MISDFKKKLSLSFYFADYDQLKSRFKQQIFAKI